MRGRMEPYLGLVLVDPPSAAPDAGPSPVDLTDPLLNQINARLRGLSSAPVELPEDEELRAWVQRYVEWFRQANALPVQRAAEWRERPSLHGLRADSLYRGAPPLWPAALARPMTVDEALAAVDREADNMAAELAEGIAYFARELVAPELVEAVLARPDVAEQWPWPEPYPERDGWCAAWAAWSALRGDFDPAWVGSTTPLAADHQLVQQGFAQAGDLIPRAGDQWRAWWPGEAAPLDVARWARDALNRLEAGRGDEEVENAEAGRMLLHRPLVGANGEVLFRGGLALLYLAERDARSSAAVGIIRMPATRDGRAALSALAAGPPKAGHGDYPYDFDAYSADPDGRWACLELVWDGRPKPIQLRLDFDGQGIIDAELLRGILGELAEDGVRDWLTLHRMAGEQGASGRILWTWQEHRQRTSYDRLIATKNATDAELAEAVVQRLWRMKQTELRLLAAGATGDALGWRRVGPFGLLDIPAGVDVLTKAGRSLRAAVVDINPDTYRGAQRGVKSPHFALLPEAALELPPRAMRLLAFLFYDFTYAYKDGGEVTRTAAQLWEYASIRQGKRTPPKRWPAAIKTLEADLDTIGRAVGAGWGWTRQGEATAAATYKIRPPYWWTDRAVLGVPAHYGPSLAAVPRTWGEVREWRSRNGLSQRKVAELLGCAQATVSRGERDPATPLPPGAVDRLAMHAGSSGGPDDSLR